MSRLGANYAGDIPVILPERDEPLVARIQGALDAVNDMTGEFLPRDRDLQVLMAITTIVEGKNGDYQTFEDLEQYFQTDGVYVDPNSYASDFNQWNFHMKGYSVKNGEIDKETKKTMRKNGKTMAQIEEMIMRKSEGIMMKYDTIFKPYSLGEALIHVPSDGGSTESYYDGFGALLNVKVSDNVLQDADSSATAGELRSPIRNHWRAVEDATVGFSESDSDFVLNYFDQYNDVETGNVLVMGTRKGLREFEKGLKDEKYTGQKYLDTEVTVDRIGNYSLHESKIPSDDFLIFVATEGADRGQSVLMHFIHEDPEFQGLTIENVNGDSIYEFEDTSDLYGAKHIINEFGNFGWGRHRIMIMDLRNEDADRIMQADGFTEVKRKLKANRAKWLKEVNSSKADQ